MKRGAILAVLALAMVGACVQTTRYTMRAPSMDTAAIAVSAAHEVEVARGVLFVCDEEKAYALANARIEDESVCGRYHQHGQEPSDRCFPIESLTGIGVPRRSSAFGYFVVPIFPSSCEVER